MKDGRTHLAYKAEHVIDVDTDLIVAAEVYEANAADSQTMADSLMVAVENTQQANANQEITEVVADKGYHSAEQLELVQCLGFRTYIPEPKRRGRSRWTDKPAKLRRAVYANRRRTKTAKSRRLQRCRSERVERTFAHVCETGGSRRTWLRGIINVQKRMLTSAMARNLGLVMRKLFGYGTPRSLQPQGGPAATTQTDWFIMQCHITTAFSSCRLSAQKGQIGAWTTLRCPSYDELL